MKIIRITSGLLIVILMTTLLSTGDMLAKSPYIKSISPIFKSVYQDNYFKLPAKVTAKYSNNTKKSVMVKWATTKVDTSKTGKMTFYGKVTGYKYKVKLVLTIKVPYMSDIMKPYFGNCDVISFSEPAIINSVKYYKGYEIEDWGDGSFSFNLQGKYKTIYGILGFEDDSNYNDAAIQFIGDGEIIKTYDIKAGSLAQKISLDVTNVSKLDFSYDIDGWGKICYANFIIRKK